MALDPIAAGLLEQMAAAGGPAINELDPPAAREMAGGFLPLAGEPEEVAESRDINIPGPGGDIPATVTTPKGAGNGPLGCLIYYHGGGWVLGDRVTLNPTVTRLANQAGCKVVSIDYRLAPEHKFPAPLDDCYATLQWVVANASTLGIDPAKIAVGGDSAGGNLAAAVALRARDEKGPAIKFQVLVYPVTHHDFGTVSYSDNADGYLLTRTMMDWFWNHYVRDANDSKNPYVSPLLAKDLSGLPDAVVYTAEFDPLRDEGEAYAKRMSEAGVSVAHKRYDGQIHAFWQMGGVFPAAADAIADAAAHLRKAFA